MYVCKTLRQYLNPIYVMLHLSGFKTLILSKGFICYRIEVLTQAVYLKAPKLLSPLTGKLKTDFSSQIFKGLTPESHLYTILDGQILVIFTYLLTKPKLTVDVR